MKRATLIFAVLSLLIIADGIYLEVSNNQQGCGCNGDSGTLFGGATSINLSTGTEVLIGGVLLLIVTGIVWLVGLRRRSQPLAGGRRAAPARSAALAGSVAQTGANGQTAPTEPTAPAAPAASAASAAPAASAAQASRPPAPPPQAQVSATAPGQAGQAGKETGDQR